jgi:hypothetical protein
LDGPFVYVGSQFTVVIHAGILTIPILGRALKAADSLFIGSSAASKQSRRVESMINH